MSYTPTEWQAGDIVTATKLNNIEQGLVGVSSNNWELIKEETFTHAEVADKEINTDSNGDSFELTDVILCFELPKNENAAGVGAYGKIQAFVNDTETASAMVGTMSRAANGDALCARAFFLQKDKLLIKFAQMRGTHSNTSNLTMMCTTALNAATTPIQLLDAPVGFTSVRIPQVNGTCHYKLFGKRK